MAVGQAAFIREGHLGRRLFEMEASVIDHFFLFLA